jgi:aminomethyltransferase
MAKAQHPPKERRTPLYDIHLRTGSGLVRGGGDYMLPLSYTSPVEEHVNTRTNVGMQDLSSMGEVDVKGPGAERLINRLLVNDILDMHPGQVRYSTLCDEQGRILDDVTVYKFGDEHFMVVTSSGPRKQTARWIIDHAVGTGAYATDLSGAVALLSVQGPRSRDFLGTVADAELSRLRYFRFTNGNVLGTEAIISRTGYTGEMGYELYVPAEEAAVLWERLLAAGRDHGLRPYGVAAMQSLRIEKAYPLYGPDIDGEQSPFEVGLHRWIRFDKRDFVGREALLRRQEMGLQERFVGLVLDSELPATNGDPILTVADIAAFRERMYTGSEAGEQLDAEIPGAMQVGRVTSSARGHTVGKMLALGYVGVSHSWIGARLIIIVGGRPVSATVAATPFFDPEGIRLRATGPRTVDAGHSGAPRASR